VKQDLATRNGGLPDSPTERRRLVALAVADRDTDTLKQWRDMADAMERLALRQDLQELHLDAGDMRLRVERGLALLDVEAAPQGRPGKGNVGDTFSAPLAEVRPNTRADIRWLAQLDEQETEQVLERLRERGTMDTGAAARLARELHPKPKPPKPRISSTERRMLEADELDERLAIIAREALWLRENTAKRFGYVRGAAAADRLREQLRKIDERLGVVREVFAHDFWEYRDQPEETR
jgi:hypothetical protein